MPVERNKDGSITIRNGKEVIGISKIISTDLKRMENYEQWVDKCAVQIKPSSHSFKETEAHFINLCDTELLPASYEKIKVFQNNIVLNNYVDKLTHKPFEFSFDASDEEMELWYQNDKAVNEELRNSPPEKFGLVIRGYILPRTKRNEIYYNEARESMEKAVREMDAECKSKPVMQDICFFFEETNEFFSSYSMSGSLMKELILYRGVSEEDIANRTFRFKSYINTLREMGKLPGFN